MAKDSGAVVTARRDGVVTRVTADEVIVDTERGDVADPRAWLESRLRRQDRYRIKKYWRTNQDTAINQRPLVHLGQRVKEGDILADGAATEQGQLALGSNVTVAFMPWYGHNFEDAIVLSERLVKDDVYSSIHIQELELHVRDTKRGQEEITREIPNVSEEALLDLDERGIVRIGAHVKPGDILVGKVTPKDEIDRSPEDILLAQIFGEKTKDGKDSSLKASPGSEGVVVDVRIFSRIENAIIEQDRNRRIDAIRAVAATEKLRVNELRDSELRPLLEGQTVALALRSGTVHEAIHAGTILMREHLSSLQLATLDLKTFRVENKKSNEQIRTIIEAANDAKASIEEQAEERIDRILQPDELPPGVIQLVKVYLAEKRKISVGDKMAGRHGNKGIVARIVPEEDMPFLPDGRPVDIVLNPLGVPSRMNVGQILETHLGWAAKILGFYAKTPVFQGANEREIGLLLKLAGVTWSAQALGLPGGAPVILDADIRTALGGLKPDRETVVDKADRLQDATINDLGASGVSPETREMFTRIRDFLGTAARELAAREQAELGNALAANRTVADDEDETQSRRGDAGRAADELDIERHAPAVALLLRKGTPALAGLLTDAQPVDVDAAAVELIRAAGLTPFGKVRLRDGLSGEEFQQPVTVGELYMLRLNHMVDDKIHARSIGPYSEVTQQPLAGKAQFGGQRFGEMEVWALEAYGAAYTLQEILTVKSDDVKGRIRVSEAIVKGQNLPEPGIPESFNVLVKELQALCIKVTLGQTPDGFEAALGAAESGDGLEDRGVAELGAPEPGDPPHMNLAESAEKALGAATSALKLAIDIARGATLPGLCHPESEVSAEFCGWRAAASGRQMCLRVTKLPADAGRLTLYCFGPTGRIVAQRTRPAPTGLGLRVGFLVTCDPADVASWQLQAD